MPETTHTVYFLRTPVIVGEGIWKELALSLEERIFHWDKVCMLADENTAEHCVPVVRANVEALRDAPLITIPAAEQSKTIDTCSHVWKQLADLGMGRLSLLVNVGGGMVSDLGGFVAASYQRGIRFVHVPTSLMAMTDASLGGKTGVNLTGLKNQVGLFAHPFAVFVWPGFLKTLPESELLSGYAEMIKHALIADADLWRKLSVPPLEAADWQLILEASIAVKAGVVSQDPEESGLRKILNFGHTIGHAIESHFLTNDCEISHGKAVAMGMVCESYLSHQLSGLTIRELNKIVRKLIEWFTLEPLDAAFFQHITALTQYDKKNKGGDVRAALLNAIGSATFDVVVTEGQMLESLHYYNEKVMLYA